MLEGDEYEDQLLGDPNNLDDFIEARDLDPLENENHAGDAHELEKDQGDGDDKEVKPKRRVVNHMPKLDVLRLTGPRGIAIVEKLFSDFKFYGPGYEAHDLTRIMQRFELWGNRLFPKYQYDDLLEKVEKLGNKKAVANFVDKIRMGVVNEDSVAEDLIADNDIIGMVDDEDSNIETCRGSNENAFDQLLNEQLTQVDNQHPTQYNVAQVGSQNKITDEQRQRMLQNHLLAEQRRLARLKANEEKNEESNNEINCSASKISSNKSEDVDGLTNDNPVVCFAGNEHPESICEDNNIEMAESVEKS